MYCYDYSAPAVTVSCWTSRPVVIDCSGVWNFFIGRQTCARIGREHLSGSAMYNQRTPVWTRGRIYRVEPRKTRVCHGVCLWMGVRVLLAGR